MKKNISLTIILIWYFITIQTTFAALNDGMANLRNTVLGGGTSEAIFKGIALQDETNLSALIFQDDETIDITLSITVDPIDEELRSELYLVTKYNQQWFYRDSSGEWQAMQDDMSNLESYTEKNLQATEVILLSTEQLMGPGEYLIYGGYLNHQSKVVYNQQAIGFIIFSADSPELHQIQSEQLLTSYFQKAIGRDDYEIISTSGSSTSGGPSDSTSSSAINTSSTNLQEQGVDEADTIKTNGNHLFALDNCQNSYNITCLFSYQINDSPVSNQFLSLYQFDSEYSKGKIYLTNLETDEGAKDTIVRISGSHSFSWWWWGYSSYFETSKTEINLLDVSNPASVQAISNIIMEGTLISSRRIDNKLYLVTRTAPVIEGYNAWYPAEPNEWVTQEEIDANLQLLANFSIYDLIPTITMDNNPAIALHQVDGCYITPHSSSKKLDKSIISMTVVPLDEPENYQSTCIIGSTETFYASPNALYLASSRYDIVPETDPSTETTTQIDYKTELHKFSFSEQFLNYSGSGTIDGRLGWNNDKKPFRLGEFNGELAVATSDGSFWSKDASVKLTILRENEDIGELEQIGTIDSIGNSQSSLQSSRFMGNRAYLFTTYG